MKQVKLAFILRFGKVFQRNLTFSYYLTVLKNYGPMGFNERQRVLVSFATFDMLLTRQFQPSRPPWNLIHYYILSSDEG